MITEDYVSYEVAKLLKEKGFNEKVSTHYLIHPSGFPEFFDKKDEFTEPGDVWLKCPTLQMAMKWLREVHRLFICVEIGVGAYVWNITNTTDHVVVYVDATVGTYEEACEAALKYCLENLI